MTAALIEAWLAPAEGSDPAGPDPRALPAYQAVRDEIARLESPTAGACRWDVVEREAGSVLRASKDLGTAAYLAGALAHRRGLDGLVLGTSLLAGLIQRYETIHPARARARAGALSWYLERAETMAAATTVSASDRAPVLAWQEALASLDAAARARLGADAPSAHRAKEAATRLVISLPAGAAPVAVAPAAAPADASASQGSTTPPSSAAAAAPPSEPRVDSPTPAPTPPTPRIPEAPTDPARVAGYLTQLGAGLVDAARARRSTSVLDPDALRLLLAGLFLPVSRAPAAGAMPPPSPSLRADLASPGALRDPARAVEVATGVVEKQRFWLDAHHALQRTLEAAAPALAMLHASELRALLARLPGLLDGTFSDGTPFASTDARAWAAALTVAAPSTPAPDAPRNPTPLAARDALGAGNVRSALAEAQRAVDSAPDARRRFEARLELAQLALDAKSGPVALAVAAELLRESSTRGLAQWQPELEARVCALYLRAASGEKVLPLAVADVHLRLCLVDPAAAIAIARS